MRPPSSLLSILTVCMVAVPAASAMPMFNGRPPMMKPPMNSSAGSSTSGMMPTMHKPLQKPLGNGLKEYCKMISVALQKGSSTSVPSDIADQFNLTIDLLTKANALCASMKPAENPAKPMGTKPWKFSSSASSAA